MYRILIVEDEQAIARALAEELSHWGLESRCVENFRDVMAEFQAFQPQLVLLDINQLSCLHALQLSSPHLILVYDVPLSEIAS